MSVLASVASAVFWGVVLLSVLVFVHEAGHFLSARAFGLRVTEFFLGMPCRLRLSWRSRSRGTEVGVATRASAAWMARQAQMRRRFWGALRTGVGQRWRR